jgi:hypothetical protein
VATETRWVYLYDECNAYRVIGCGLRKVIANVGRKHVYIKSAHKPDSQRNKLSRRIWNQTVKSTEARGVSYE